MNCTPFTIYSFTQGIEIVPLIVLNLTKQNWLIVGLHKTSSLKDMVFISQINDTLIFYINFYDNILLMDDFINMMPVNRQLQIFWFVPSINFVKFESKTLTTTDLSAFLRRPFYPLICSKNRDTWLSLNAGLLKNVRPCDTFSCNLNCFAPLKNKKNSNKP